MQIKDQGSLSVSLFAPPRDHILEDPAAHICPFRDMSVFCLPARASVLNCMSSNHAKASIGAKLRAG